MSDEFEAMQSPWWQFASRKDWNSHSADEQFAVFEGRHKEMMFLLGQRDSENKALRAENANLKARVEAAHHAASFLQVFSPMVCRAHLVLLNMGQPPHMAFISWSRAMSTALN